MTFEYQVKNNITVSRLFLSDRLQDDYFAIIRDGENIAEVAYDQARDFWLGRVTLDEVLADGNST